MTRHPGPAAAAKRPAGSDAVRDLARRIQAEYAEMPGLSVTLAQAQRLWVVDRETCDTVFERLITRGVVKMTTHGRFVRA